MEDILYDFNTKWVDIDKKSDSFVIKQSEYAALDAFHDSEVQRIFNGQINTRGKEVQQSASSARGNSNQKTSPSGKAPDRQTSQPATRNEPNKENAALYMIKLRLVSTNAKGQSTPLEMVCLEDGTIVKAFLRGNNEAVTEGVKLKNIKLTERQGTNRNYNVLEEFEIAS